MRRRKYKDKFIEGERERCGIGEIQSGKSRRIPKTYRELGGFGGGGFFFDFVEASFVDSCGRQGRSE
jgi:hypothetical protein